MLNGVRALHSDVGICHLDIKLENVLIGKDFELKLCDFGFAKPIDEPIAMKMGTFRTMAPEVLHL